MQSYVQVTKEQHIYGQLDVKALQMLQGMSIIVPSQRHTKDYELNYKTNVCCIHNCLCTVQQDKLHSNMEKKSQH